MYEALMTDSSLNPQKERRMKPIEEVDFDKLVDMCKQINEVCDNKIEVVGKSIADKKELLDAFTVQMEGMSEEDQDRVPGAVDFYNEVYSDEASKQEEKEPAPPPADDKKEEKKEKKEAKATKKKAAKKPRKKKESKEKKPPKQKDDFGYTVGTRNSLFAQAIKSQPMTMKEVRELPWNEKNVTFYEEFKKLKNSGKADKDEQGRMFIK
jgi:hypothetical protein